MLAVVRNRVHELLAEVQKLQTFLLHGQSGPPKTHKTIVSSLKSIELLFEGLMSAIEKEQDLCLKNLQDRLPDATRSRTSSESNVTRICVDDAWEPAKPVFFKSAGVEYQMTAPPGTKAGDWLQFDSTTYILSKFNR
jgi:hypothetical protein